MLFVFEYGSVLIDIMGSRMTMRLNNGILRTYDLQTHNSTRDHANGDEYIARAILGLPMKKQHKATFSDPIVQLENLGSLVSEQQTASREEGAWVLEKVNNNWSISQ